MFNVLEFTSFQTTFSLEGIAGWFLVRGYRTSCREEGGGVVDRGVGVKAVERDLISVVVPAPTRPGVDVDRYN
jgi:hypothetical protein